MRYVMNFDFYIIFQTTGDSTTSHLNDNNVTSKVNLDNLGYFIEISQVGLTDVVYAHTDSISQEHRPTKKKVQDIFLLIPLKGYKTHKKV